LVKDATSYVLIETRKITSEAAELLVSVQKIAKGRLTLAVGRLPIACAYPIS
jgi:hypothetical protein